MCVLVLLLLLLSPAHSLGQVHAAGLDIRGGAHAANHALRALVPLFIGAEAVELVRRTRRVQNVVLAFILGARMK